MRSQHLCSCLLLGLAFGAGAAAPDESAFARQRQQMVGQISALAGQTSAETGRAQFDARVLRALGTVPRHRFVPDDVVDDAYDNRPLPIGFGQTISQPYIVALMTDLLDVGPDAVVLEVGTGSGYQAAVLSPLVRQVYTIEIVAPLAKRATAVLQALGYRNVTTRVADGYYGWREHAPFDGIVVTAASGSVPPPLVEQLKPGGRMVIPVGASFYTQQLLLVEKAADGQVTTRQLLPVRFVPLTGNH